MYDLNRFLKIQEKDYPKALQEIRKGRKVSHWIWYIFPQLKGLGQSAMSEFYGIQNLEEAKAYLENDCLREHLIEISKALLDVSHSTIQEIVGADSVKVFSSMTLFHLACPNEPIFLEVLKKYFDGVLDQNTWNLLRKDLSKVEGSL